MVLKKNTGRHSREDCTGSISNWSVRRAVQLSQQRSKISLIACLERIKSLKSDFF